MAIAKKLSNIMGKVSRVAKNGRNDFHKYDYVTEADLVEAIREHMSDEGVAFFPTVKSLHQTGDITQAELEFRFIDSEDGSELVSVFWGTGQDKGDKGAYKAYTGAVKYALMKTFLVPTGETDDPEHDGKTPPKPSSAKPATPVKPRPPAESDDKPTHPPATSKPSGYIDEKQRKQLWSLAKNTGYTQEQFGDAVREAGFASSSVIPVEKYDAMVDHFRNFAPPEVK